jgi:RNA polymerase sigma-70 factor (ECF subfamily)
LDADFLRNLDDHYSAVYRFVYRMVGRRETAQDVTQEAFTRLAAHTGPLQGALACRRWVFVVARNLAVSQLRESARRTELAAESIPLEAPAPAPFDGEAATERAAAVAKAVMALPTALREVVLMREYESMSYAEIAVVAGCSAGTVKSRLARARERLRQTLRITLEVNP